MSEPIRVLHIVTYMGRGGLETMLMNYYRNMDRTKVQFDFLVHRDFEADYDQEILSLGGKIYHMPRLVPWSLSYKKQLCNFFKKHSEYKIVHVHQDCLSSVALKCAKECGIPVKIAHSHSSSAIKDIKYPIKMHYMKSITKYATDCFACAKQAGDWMFSGNQYKIIKNAIDAQKYSYSKERTDELIRKFDIKDKFVIGHVGRFRKEKNHEFLIDIFQEVIKKEPTAILMLVGDGEEQEKIKEKVRQLQLDNSVLFMGARNDVHELLQVMNVFVLPSLYEGLPVTMIEAQAAGVSCVISDQVPLECKITNLITQVNLDDSLEIWGKVILEKGKIGKVNTYSDICNAGFDIVSNAKQLQEFYLKKEIKGGV